MKRPEGAVSSPVDPTINLCHPDDETLPDCYHLYTVYHRPLTWLDAQRSTPEPRCLCSSDFVAAWCPLHGAPGARWPATPPLVAAPPVPPVVPDSEATCDDCKSPLGDCLVVQERDNEFCCESCSHTEPFGSGVVPDKPALACPHYWNFSQERNANVCVSCRAVVPAVTDDEAATTVIYRALRYFTYDRDRPGSPDQQRAGAVVAHLREAGFLIVHHTKET
jgi:hypothetical protein